MNKIKLIPKAISYKHRSVKFVNGWAKVPSAIDMRLITKDKEQEFEIERGLDGKYWIASFEPLQEAVDRLKQSLEERNSNEK